MLDLLSARSELATGHCVEVLVAGLQEIVAVLQSSQMASVES